MITMNDIIREGHPTLITRAEDVPLPLSDEHKNTLLEMRQFIINSQDPQTREQYELREGVGLAAPQINRSLRMLAIHTLDEKFETLHDYMLINPKIIAHSQVGTYMPGGEGCLSVDREVEGLVRRYKNVRIRTHLLDPETHEVYQTTLRLKNFPAIVFQHELDHINGILFISKVEDDLPGIEPIEFQKPQDEPETQNDTKEEES